MNNTLRKKVRGKKKTLHQLTPLELNRQRFLLSKHLMQDLYLQRLKKKEQLIEERIKELVTMQKDVDMQESKNLKTIPEVTESSNLKTHFLTNHTSTLLNKAKGRQRRNQNLSTQQQRDHFLFSKQFSAQVSTKYKEESLSPNNSKNQLQMLSIINDSKLEKLVFKKDAQTSSMKPFINPMEYVFNSSNEGSVDYSQNEPNLVLNQDIRDEGEKLILEHSYESSHSDEKLRIKDLKYIKPPSL